jgi:hypothetical protein
MRKSLNKNKEYNQGVFIPQNSQKYKGSFPIYFRSSLELKVYRWMDSNDKVVTWGSESVIIPYMSPLDNKLHRYFVDLVVCLRESDGTLKKLLIEIKPEKFLQAPKITPRKSKKTVLFEQTQYIINNAKWEAARKRSEKNGYTFFVMTEKDINKKL